MLAFCDLKKGTHTVNFKKIEGNRTNSVIYKAFEKILVVEGYDELDLSKLEAAEEMYDELCIECEFEFPSCKNKIGCSNFKIIEKYLGKGRKIADATPEQVEMINLIVTEIEDELMHS